MSAVRKIFSRCGEAVVKGAAAERLVADSVVHLIAPIVTGVGWEGDLGLG